MTNNKLQLNVESDDKFIEDIEKAWKERKEGISSPEAEKAREQAQTERGTETKGEGKSTLEASEGLISSGPTPVVQQKDIRLKKVEHVLEDGLSELYIKMSPDKQREFKLIGEQTAQQINEMLNEAKVKISKVIELIKKWLAIIPGINKFFLEQEAKIKADEIMKIDSNRDRKK